MERADDFKLFKVTTLRKRRSGTQRQEEAYLKFGQDEKKNHLSFSKLYLKSKQFQP